jgi:phage N-6-adenine-methyltransferase
VGLDVVAPALFSSTTEEWSTPNDTFYDLDADFHFVLDAAASDDNAKCDHYFTKEQDALQEDWTGFGGPVFCNPPYGRGITGQWVKKAAETAAQGTTVVMLLPARTDTRWFHYFIYKQPSVEVRFVKGRLKFGGSKTSAPFPSMVVVFRPEAP